MKTWIAICCLLLLCSTAWTGGQTAAKTAGEKVISLTWMIDHDAPVTEGGFVDYIKEKYGFDIQFLVAPEPNYMDKFNLTIASGDLPDIMQAQDRSGAVMKEYGAQGAFIALNDLVPKYAPDIDKTVDPVEWKILSDVETGKFYCIPKLVAHSFGTNQLLVSGVSMRKVGGKLPENLDDLYQLAVKFKNQDPAGGGKTIPVLPQHRGYIFGFSDFFASFDSSSGWYIDGGNVKFGPATDGYRDALVYINKLWEEELLWKDVMGLENREESWRLQPSGQIGAFIGSLWDLPHWRRRVEEAGKDWDKEFDILLAPPLKSKTGKQWVNLLSRINRVNGITSACEDVEGALTFLNFWYTDEGRKLVLYGLEGTHYTVNSDGSINQESHPLPEAMEWGAFWTKLCQLYPPEEKMDMYAKFPQPSSQKPEFERIYESTSKNMKDWNLDRNLEFILRSRLTVDEVKEINNVLNPVNTFVLEESAKFIVGDRPFSEWDAYVASIEKMQIDKVRVLYQKANKMFFD